MTQPNDPFATALRASAALFAFDDRTAIEVRGKDRVAWLNGLVTCELAKLGPREATYGLLVEKKGRIQVDMLVVPTDDALLLAVPTALVDTVEKTLDHYLIMEDAELAKRDVAFFAAHGPRAEELLGGATAGGRLDLLGLGGVVLACPADAGSADLLATLEAIGGVVGTAAQWDALRIERGLPRFGVEFDTTLYPQEAALEKRAVSFSKGCYLGQEVVYMLENRGHVKQKLVALDLDPEGALASAGTEVTTEGGEAVGQIRSAAIGPLRGTPVAIAMVKWAQTKAGTELRVAGRRAVVRASDPA